MKLGLAGHYIACREAKSHDEDANSQAHGVDECLLKEVGKPQAALALYLAWYNFCRIHQTLGVTPAMEAGITDHIWSVEELLQTISESRAA
jgi:hypothetical protein